MCMTEFCGSSDYCNKCINNPNGGKKTMEKINLEQENKLLKSFLYCTKKSCNNCGYVKCENFQRQRIDCCGRWISFKDYIAELKKENAELKDYNKKLLQSDIDKQNKIVLLSKKVNDLQKKNVGLKDQLNKAKVIINKWLRVYNTNTTKEVIKESVDFLKECE